MNSSRSPKTFTFSSSHLQDDALEKNNIFALAAPSNSSASYSRELDMLIFTARQTMIYSLAVAGSRSGIGFLRIQTYRVPFFTRSRARNISVKLLAWYATKLSPGQFLL
ncbi:hypothetical protein C8R44DRAFT_3234 [Mycena epipterygia]|nr:hypothetical protein C8R44DRAFT_3234 [Mycena epipterygia]